jgi:hypothetical protein
MANQILPENSTLVKTQTGYIARHVPAAVSYDRSARQYIVANGREIGRFPAGRTNRVRAEWLALSYNDGRLYEAARSLVTAGHDEGRTLRAAELILAGRVIEREKKGSYSRAVILAVAGNYSPETGAGRYYVYFNIIWQCDCQDWLDRRESGERQPICKHNIAVMLLERLAGEDERELDAIALREWEHLAERNAARLAELRAECDQCHGKGTVTGVDTWTGIPRTMKCACQIDF